MDGFAGKLGLLCSPVASLDDSEWAQRIKAHKGLVLVSPSGAGIVACLTVSPSCEETCMSPLSILGVT